MYNISQYLLLPNSNRASDSHRGLYAKHHNDHGKSSVIITRGFLTEISDRNLSDEITYAFINLHQVVLPHNGSSRKLG